MIDNWDEILPVEKDNFSMGYTADRRSMKSRKQAGFGYASISFPKTFFLQGRCRYAQISQVLL